MVKERKYIPDKIKVKVIKNQNFRCGICQKQVFGFTMQIHHKDQNPMNDVLENLQAVCVSCHYKIHGKMPHGNFSDVVSFLSNQLNK